MNVQNSSQIKQTDERKIAVVSMTSTHDKARNISNAIEGIEKAAAMGCDWVQLPEVFTYHGPYESMYEAAEEEIGPINEKLAALARRLHIVIFAGSAAERSPNQSKTKVFNTSYVFDRDGSIAAKYRKIHLFNLYDDRGSPLYCESEGYLAGEKAVVFEIEGFRCGMAICYDLRFPKFLQKLLEHTPIDVLTMPSAFTYQTGLAHWALLLRARAVEMQCYVYAANQVGWHSENKRSFGHGMIVDPWGEILANAEGEVGVFAATISKKRISEIRAKVPSLANRRPALY